MSKKLLVYFVVASTLSTPVQANSLTDYAESLKQSILDYARKNPHLVADMIGLVVAGGFALFLFHKRRVEPGEYVFKSPRWVDAPNYGQTISRTPQVPSKVTTRSMTPEVRELLEDILQKAKELRGLNSDASSLRSMN